MQCVGHLQTDVQSHSPKTKHSPEKVHIRTSNSGSCPILSSLLQLRSSESIKCGNSFFGWFIDLVISLNHLLPWKLGRSDRTQQWRFCTEICDFYQQRVHRDTLGWRNEDGRRWKTCAFSLILWFTLIVSSAFSWDEGYGLQRGWIWQHSSHICSTAVALLSLVFLHLLLLLFCSVRTHFLGFKKALMTCCLWISIEPCRSFLFWFG